MRRRSDQYRLSCVLMRGGTSKGPFLHAADLPEDVDRRDRVLLRLMGALEPRRIDGIGGVDGLTNKIAIISPSSRPDCDVEYLFGQICVHKNTIDYSVNCGNMLAAVGPFAIDEGIVGATGNVTSVRIFNVNTGVRIVATVETRDGAVIYDGTAAIDGAPGNAAPIWLDFQNSGGAKTGRLLPTGRPIDVIDGIEVSCVDASVPMAVVAASAFQLTGYESADEINHDQALLDRIEFLRQAAGRAMGLGDVAKLEMPKLTLVAAPARGGTITGRYIMPYTCHSAFAVTGAICLATAAVLPGTVAQRFAAPTTSDTVIEHPLGTIQVDIELGSDPSGMPTIAHARLLRTARRLFAGEVYLPARAVDAPRSTLNEEISA